MVNYKVCERGRWVDTNPKCQLDYLDGHECLPGSRSYDSCGGDYATRGVFYRDCTPDCKWGPSSGCRSCEEIMKQYIDSQPHE